MAHIIVDLEATCWNEGSFGRDQMEIIEIGAVEFATRQGPVEDEFSTLVQPVATRC